MKTNLTKARWGLLPRCQVTNKMCGAYERGRCRDLNPCSFKEKKEVAT